MERLIIYKLLECHGEDRFELGYYQKEEDAQKEMDDRAKRLVKDLAKQSSKVSYTLRHTENAVYLNNNKIFVIHGIVVQ